MYVNRINEGVVRVGVNFKTDSLKEKIKILVMSDQHFDSKQCDRKMLKSHFDQAKELNSPVLMLGDWFDAMQTRNDKRSMKSSLKAAYLNAYLDDLVDETVEFLEPYSKNIAVWAWGNHESAILRNNETRLITRAIEILRLKTKSNIMEMPYRGWIFLEAKDPRNKIRSKAVKIAYTHGDGGSAPVTRGAIKSARRAVMWPDADLFLSGHIHAQLTMPIPRYRITERGYEYEDEQIHAQLPTYKTKSKHDGWEVEKGFGPPNMGGLWIELMTERNGDHRRVYADVIRAL